MKRPTAKVKRTKPTKSSTRKSSVGTRLVKSLMELRDGLASGAPVEERFAVRTVELGRLVAEGESSIEREGTALRERARAAREGEAPAEPDLIKRTQA